MNRSRFLPFLLIVLLSPAPVATGVAANKAAATPPATSQPTPVRKATFSFVCATSATAFPPKVKEIATRLARERKADGATPWGDRSVALRLRRGDAPTYFVPLACGTNGSCSWGIVTANPAKSIGVVSGAVLSVETFTSDWPAIQVYSSASGQTRVETLRLSQGQYTSRPAERAAPESIDRLRSCFDNASCCPRLQ
jgi:hypothetical protein